MSALLLQARRAVEAALKKPPTFKELVVNEMEKVPKRVRLRYGLYLCSYIDDRDLSFSSIDEERRYLRFRKEICHAFEKGKI